MVTGFYCYYGKLCVHLRELGGGVCVGGGWAGTVQGMGAAMAEFPQISMPKKEEQKKKKYTLKKVNKSKKGYTILTVN